MPGTPSPTGRHPRPAQCRARDKRCAPRTGQRWPRLEQRSRVIGFEYPEAALSVRPYQHRLRRRGWRPLGEHLQVAFARRLDVLRRSPCPHRPCHDELHPDSPPTGTRPLCGKATIMPDRTRGSQVRHPPGAGEFVQVGRDAVDDRAHPRKVDGDAGGVRPVAGSPSRTSTPKPSAPARDCPPPPPRTHISVVR